MTYAVTRFESSSVVRLLLALLHDHGVVVGAGRNDHGGIGVTTVDTLIEHNILRIVFPKVEDMVSLNIRELQIHQTYSDNVAFNDAGDGLGCSIVRHPS